MAREVKIALLQARAAREPERNLARTLELIGEAAGRGAKLVVTGELFRSQYFCQSENHAHFELAEAVPGPTTQALAGAARQHGVTLVGSVFERRAAGIYHNTAVVLDADGTLAGVYRKMHIPDDPLYYEKFYFTPGDLGFRSFATQAGRVGTIVCWDQWFPEAARLTALAGAEILSIPTAIGWHPSEKVEFGSRQLEAWQTAQRAHAIANGIFVAVVNRVGLERDPLHPGGDGIEFWGHSFVADPSGRVIAEAGEGEEILIADCDLDAIEETRRHWPFLRDRRLDAYSDLTKRFRD